MVNSEEQRLCPLQLGIPGPEVTQPFGPAGLHAAELPAHPSMPLGPSARLSSLQNVPEPMPRRPQVASTLAPHPFSLSSPVIWHTGLSRRPWRHVFRFFSWRSAPPRLRLRETCGLWRVQGHQGGGGAHALRLWKHCGRHGSRTGGGDALLDFRWSVPAHACSRCRHGRRKIDARVGAGPALAVFARSDCGRAGARRRSTRCARIRPRSGTWPTRMCLPG